jgi:hypothetical protein
MGKEDQVKILADKIKIARETNSVAYFKNIFTETPGWQEFIDHLNYEYWNSSIPAQIANPGQPEIHHNGVCVRQNFYLNVRRPGYDLESLGSSMNICSLVKEAINSLDGAPLTAFINFVKQPVENLNIHYDSKDMAYWQCIGSVEWRVYGKSTNENKEANAEKYESYILNPGDFLFVPELTYHAIQVNEPRAAISFGFNDKEWK